MSKMTNELVDEWVTATLKRVVLSVHTALMDKPPELPDYLESEIVSNGIRTKIRVDFEKPKPTIL